MPDVHISVTVPAQVLWALVIYLTFGLLAYLPLLAWTNLRLISGTRPALQGASIPRAVGCAFNWPLVLVAAVRVGRSARARQKAHAHA